MDVDNNNNNNNNNINKEFKPMALSKASIQQRASLTKDNAPGFKDDTV